jgi:hypothetical protein
MNKSTNLTVLSMEAYISGGCGIAPVKRQTQKYLGNLREVYKTFTTETFR